MGLWTCSYKPNTHTYIWIYSLGGGLKVIVEMIGGSSCWKIKEKLDTKCGPYKSPCELTHSVNTLTFKSLFLLFLHCPGLENPNPRWTHQATVQGFALILSPNGLEKSLTQPSCFSTLILSSCQHRWPNDCSLLLDFLPLFKNIL